MEGAFLTETPLSLIAQGKAADLPLVTSTLPGEGLLPGAGKSYEAFQSSQEFLLESISLQLKLFNYVIHFVFEILEVYLLFFISCKYLYVLD